MTADFSRSAHSTDPSIARFFQNLSEVFLNLSSFRQRCPRAIFFRNVWELEIRLLSKFHLGTTLGGDLSQSSRDSFESDSDSNKFQDVQLNSSKSSVFNFLLLFGKILANIRFDRFGTPFDSIDIASAGGGGPSCPSVRRV